MPKASVPNPASSRTAIDPTCKRNKHQSWESRDATSRTERYVGGAACGLSFEHAGIVPDILTLGKGIGGDVPLAAMLAREEICLFEAGDQGDLQRQSADDCRGTSSGRGISSEPFLARVRQNGD